MKKVKTPILLKHRAHSILFQRDLPFKPKKERVKVLYKRHTKHRENLDCFG
jgi:hypothetical protein